MEPRRKRPAVSSGVKVYRSFDNRPKPARESAQRPARNHDSTANLASSILPKLPLHSLKLAIGGVMIIAILALSYISTISVDGQSIADPQLQVSVKEAAKKYTGEQPWRHFQLFISNQDMEASIRKSVPDLADVQIKRSLLSNQVSIKVLPKRPSVLWQEGRGGPTYVVDESGKAFMQSTGKEKLPKIIQETPNVTGAVIGQIVVDSGAIRSASEWSTRLSSIQLSFDSMVITNTPRQADIVLKDKQWRIRIATDTNAAETIVYVGKALEKIASEGKDMTEYLDARIPYRIFYK